MVARQAHNLEVASSSLVPTNMFEASSSMVER